MVRHDREQYRQKERKYGILSIRSMHVCMAKPYEYILYGLNIDLVHHHKLYHGPALRRPFMVKVINLSQFSAVSFTNEPPHDKTNKMTVRPAKTQISLGILPV